MSKKLYVGNLKFSVGDQDLQQMFAAYGTVRSAQVITDRETQRSKGFGFVEMESDAAAQEAISALNGKSHEGRTLTVNEARPRENSGGGYGGGGYSGYSSGYEDRDGGNRRGGGDRGDRGGRGGRNRF